MCGTRSAIKTNSKFQEVFFIRLEQENCHFALIQIKPLICLSLSLPFSLFHASSLPQSRILRYLSSFFFLFYIFFFLSILLHFCKQAQNKSQLLVCLQGIPVSHRGKPQFYIFPTLAESVMDRIPVHILRSSFLIYSTCAHISICSAYWVQFKKASRVICWACCPCCATTLLWELENKEKRKENEWKTLI